MITRMIAVALLPIVQAFNNPPGVDIWCGKAYRAENASFNPGGWLEPPPESPRPLLDLTIRPRMSLYVAGEQQASFIVDAAISRIHGKPFVNATYADAMSNESSSFSDLHIEITVAETGDTLVHCDEVMVGSTGNELDFSLAGLMPRTSPYAIDLMGNSDDGEQTFTAQTQLYYLPPNESGGSTVKIDSLFGGLLVQDYTKHSTAWQTLFPYSYYVGWGNYLEEDIVNRVNSFAEAGYNILHVIPGDPGEPGFNFTNFDILLNRTDELGLWVMYDMRGTYTNLSAVEYQVKKLVTHKSLLLWYTADEPDGNGDPLNATVLAYDKIKSIDLYHPISLVLNCYNFYYKEYTAGADIVMQDAYPIDVNTSFSTVYNTVCNTTYGCCGCDDCHGNLEDISTRLDRLADYQSWICGAPKPIWSVPQAFGNGEFWTGTPTAAQETVVDLLSINHGAKGLVAWTYPTTDELATVTSQLSSVLSGPAVVEYTLGANPVPLVVNGASRVDAAGWRLGNKMLVSMAFLEEMDSQRTVSITLPASAEGIDSVLLGNAWSVEGGKLVKESLQALEADLFVVSLKA